MAGGKNYQLRLRCARRGAASLLGGLLLASPVMADAATTDSSAASTAAAVEDCTVRPSERSIVVDQKKSTSIDSGVVTATDLNSDDLQPIANVSEYEPDLAEAAAGGSGEALVPTLADPPPDNRAPGTAPRVTATEDEPTAEDVCIDDAVSEPAAVTDGADFAEATDDVTPTEYQAAGFNGMTPGVSSRQQLLEAWGAPLQSDTHGKTLSFQPEGFSSIEVLFTGNTVATIRVELQRPAQADDLVEKLGLSQFRPVTIRNPAGDIAAATYPERGVTLTYLPSLGDAVASDDASASAEPAVSKIIMRPIQAEVFVARAESADAADHRQRLVDLETALELDGRSASIRHRLSEVKLKARQVTAAEQLAGEAVELAEDDDAYRLQWAKCLMALGRYDEATEQTRIVLEGNTAPPIVRAEALHQMGLVSAFGATDVAARAVALHNKAIELGDELAASDEPIIQAKARQVLLNAHLAIAERIGAGDWQNKDQAVEQWISRGSAIAEQMIADRQGDESLRLQVAYSALRAGSHLSPPINPALWVDEAEEAAKTVESRLADSVARDELHWQLGLAYVTAAEIQHRRGEAKLAISYGELADAAMTPLADAYAELPDTNYVLGRVYFQIGAVHAVHNNDHDAACQWYDRAADLLLQPTPSRTALVQPGQHGDALVSMGVSYWETGLQQRAYDLTKAGYDLIDRGVSEGLLAASSLNVPQGNLQAMSRVLGNASGVATMEAGAQMARRPRTAAQPRVAGRTISTDRPVSRRR